MQGSQMPCDMSFDDFLLNLIIWYGCHMDVIYKEENVKNQSRWIP